MSKLVNRLGIFGGTFDPVHKGHIEMALRAKLQFQLDELHFVVAKARPQKIQKLFSPEQRYQFLEHAVVSLDSQEGISVSRKELDREGVSYSYKTIEEYKAEYPETELFWIMGLDSFLELATWKNANYIKSNVSFIICPRGEDKASEVVEELLASHPSAQVFVLDSSTIEISSSELKDCLEHSKPIDDLVPAGTRDIILETYKSLK